MYKTARIIHPVCARIYKGIVLFDGGGVELVTWRVYVLTNCVPWKDMFYFCTKDIHYPNCLIMGVNLPKWTHKRYVFLKVWPHKNMFSCHKIVPKRIQWPPSYHLYPALYEIPPPFLVIHAYKPPWEKFLNWNIWMFYYNIL